MSILQRIKTRIHLSGPLSTRRFWEGVVRATPDKLATFVPTKQRPIMQCLCSTITIMVTVTGNGQGKSSHTVVAFIMQTSIRVH